MKKKTGTITEKNQRASDPDGTGRSFSVHVADTRASFEKALREGAEPVGFSGP